MAPSQPAKNEALLRDVIDWQKELYVSKNHDILTRHPVLLRWQNLPRITNLYLSKHEPEYLVRHVLMEYFKQVGIPSHIDDAIQSDFIEEVERLESLARPLQNLMKVLLTLWTMGESPEKSLELRLAYDEDSLINTPGGAVIKALRLLREYHGHQQFLLYHNEAQDWRRKLPEHFVEMLCRRKAGVGQSLFHNGLVAQEFWKDLNDSQRLFLLTEQHRVELELWPCWSDYQRFLYSPESTATHPLLILALLSSGIVGEPFPDLLKLILGPWTPQGSDAGLLMFLKAQLLLPSRIGEGHQSAEVDEDQCFKLLSAAAKRGVSCAWSYVIRFVEEREIPFRGYWFESYIPPGPADELMGAFNFEHLDRSPTVSQLADRYTEVHRVATLRNAATQQGVYGDMVLLRRYREQLDLDELQTHLMRFLFANPRSAIELYQGLTKSESRLFPRQDYIENFFTYAAHNLNASASDSSPSYLDLVKDLPR